MDSKIIVYTIDCASQSESYVLHGDLALTTYREDERELHKTGKEPLIANNLVRFRLLQATTPPPGKLDLDAVAKLVEGTLSKISAKADICSRSWYIFVSPSPYS